MDGQPVWLASYSLRQANGTAVSTGDFNRQQRRRAERVLLDVLKGVGDGRQERLFRMCLTTCIHRAATAQEVAGFPLACRGKRSRFLAGGPLEILRESKPGRPSTQPCHAPGKVQLEPGIFFPIDCGDCPPCLGRIEAEG